MHKYLGRLVQIINLSQNGPLNGMVCEDLREAIIQGVIPVGEKLNKKVLSDYMDTSCTPVRNAIKKLTEEDLVEYISKYDVVVERVTIGNAEEIYQTRIALETMVTIAAMERMMPEDHRKVQELLRSMAEKNEAGEVQQVIRYCIDLSALMYRFSRMQRPETVVGKMLEYVSHFRGISLYDTQGRGPTVKEHGLIYRGMQIKDEELITPTVKEYLNYSEEFVTRKIICSQENMRDDLKDLYRRME